MQGKNLFNIFPRKIKNGTIIFYYYIYDTNGKRKQYSTGKRTETEAYQECLRLTRINQLNSCSSLAFDKYCADWFVYDKCEYIQNKLLHGFTYSRTFAEQERSQLKRHAIPFFGSKPLDSITSNDIEDYIKYLKNKGLSNTTVNHNLKMIRLIFGWAEKHNTILYNPMRQILNLKSDTREKGVFTDEEVNSLLFRPNILSDIWEKDENMYMLNLTAYKTGMRLGELQALCKNDIHDGYIRVQHSLDRKYGIKETKTGKIREVPISKDLQEKLIQHYSQKFGDYIFGTDFGNRPVRHDEVYKAFYKAAKRIGLSREDLTSRRISFHSWRHLLATRLVADAVPEAMVRAITGHSSRSMLDHYIHIGLNELKKIKNL
jgi:integrase